MSELSPDLPPDSTLLRRLPRGGGQIRLERDGPVARLWIDHPARRNAMSPGMMLDLGAAVDALRAFDGVAVVVCGAGGRAFCAGGDLEAVQAHLLDADGASGMQAWMRAALDGLAALPLRVIAAVEGAALGGGAELLTACDEVYAAADARIGFVHASLGVSPGWGGAARLVQRRGATVAGRALLAPGPVSGEEAHRMGLVDHVVAAGEAERAAVARAAELAALPREAARAAVRLARAADPDLERALFLRLWGGEAHRAALAARGRG